MREFFQVLGVVCTFFLITGTFVPTMLEGVSRFLAIYAACVRIAYRSFRIEWKLSWKRKNYAIPNR